jgi:hypothetical protein
MKPVTITTGRLLSGFLIAVFALSLQSWDFKQSPDEFFQDSPRKDTVPQKNKTPRERKVRDLDGALAELESIDIKLEIEKAMQEVNKAMKQVDVAKIQLEVAKAMKEMNMEKIKKDVSLALKEADMEKIKAEVEISLAKIDMDKIKAEMDRVKQIDFEQLNKEMNNVKEEMEKLGPQLEKELAKAKVDIEKAKAEIKEYKTFVDGLEKDDLINKNENYSVQHKDGKLLINGKEANEKTYNKYNSFLKKHSTFTIEKSEDDFDIDMD